MDYGLGIKLNAPCLPAGRKAEGSKANGKR